jgi:histidinol phosphatase-like enzyme (inositol monophosphatase family)
MTAPNRLRDRYGYIRPRQQVPERVVSTTSVELLPKGNYSLLQRGVDVSRARLRSILPCAGSVAVPSPKSARYESHLALAHALADLSAKAVLPHFRRKLSIEDKGSEHGFDPVTNADRAAERSIRRHLAKVEPGHGIIGEEFEARAGAGRFNWVVDPIDGTKAFIMGSPLWGTLIGLLEGESPVLGIMNQPFTGERVWSGKHGTHWRLRNGPGRRVKTRSCPQLADAILTSTSPDLMGPARNLQAFQRLKSQVRMTRYGGDCYGYCLLAAGHVDLVVEAGLKAHDVVALIPIIEGAGGRITTWEGEGAQRGGRIVAAGDPKLHEQALRILTS